MKKNKKDDINNLSVMPGSESKQQNGSDPELIKRIEEMHGKPVFTNTSGGISGINRPFFAQLIFEETELIYEPGEQDFYLYKDKNGLWELQTETQIAHLISRIFSNFCRFISRPDAIGKCNGGMIKDIKTQLAGFAGKKDFFKESQGIFIHCANGVLVYDETQKKWNLKAFNKEYRSRNRTEFIYDPEAQCPQFLNRLIHPAMSLEDVDLLQFYLGQCILGHNYSQRFLLMTGTPGGGKSTAVNVIEGIVGLFNVTELRLEHMGSRFELQRLIGNTLLTAKDVRSNFLNIPGASKLKSLVGNDVLTTETKLKNVVSQIRGNFNAIVTANNNLRVTLDGDWGAWERRMLWIKYDNPPPKEVIADFDKKLLEAEGGGIINWALEGAVKLLKNGGKIPAVTSS